MTLTTTTPDGIASVVTVDGEDDDTLCLVLRSLPEGWTAQRADGIASDVEKPNAA